MFLSKYLETFNACQSYLFAFSTKNANAAAVEGWKLLQKPAIAKRIEEFRAKLMLKAEISQDRWLAELASIGFSDIGDYLSFSPGGVTIKSSAQMTRHQRAAIRKVTETITKDGGSISMELHDKLKALGFIGNHYGWIKEHHEHTGKDGGPIEQKLQITAMPPEPATVEEWETQVKNAEKARKLAISEQ